jgi:hypothetical protein
MAKNPLMQAQHKLTVLLLTRKIAKLMAIAIKLHTTLLFIKSTLSIFGYDNNQYDKINDA